MTSYQAFAFLLAFFALWFLYKRQAVCVRCGGRGRHRSDCPYTRRDARGDSPSDR